VNTRFHQYFDVLLGDLGLSPLRKKNQSRKALMGLLGGDYDGVFAEYERRA